MAKWGINGQAQNILAEAKSYPDEIDSVEEAERIKTFLKGLRSQTREISGARLSDGRPFTDAAGVVKEWFSPIETRLKASDRRLSAILANYTSKVQREAAEIQRRNEERKAEVNRIEKEKNNVLGVAVTGESVVTVNREVKEETVELEDVPQAPDVQLIWQVKGFNRDEINLEILRPYLTDNALKLAINAYIKDNGPEPMDGAIYEQVVATEFEPFGDLMSGAKWRVLLIIKNIIDA